MRRNNRSAQVGGHPKRGTDRIEDAAACLLAVVCVAGLIIIWAYAGQVHAGQLQRARQESISRTPVAAVLMQDVRPSVLAGRSGEGPIRGTPVRWTGTDGLERVGVAVAPEQSKAGQTVTLWVDREQRIVHPPTTAQEATVVTVQVAGLLLFSLAVAVTIVWAGVLRWALARNCLGWEREWTEVEPVWSGRARGERRS